MSLFVLFCILIVVYILIHIDWTWLKAWFRK